MTNDFVATNQFPKINIISFGINSNDSYVRQSLRAFLLFPKSDDGFNLSNEELCRFVML